jgi:hypothetical protein
MGYIYTIMNIHNIHITITVYIYILQYNPSWLNQPRWGENLPISGIFAEAVHFISALGAGFAACPSASRVPVVASGGSSL